MIFGMMGALGVAGLKAISVNFGPFFREHNFLITDISHIF